MARDEHDFYPTPQPLADAIVSRLAGMIPRPERILEPSIGSGNFAVAIRRAWGEVDITGVDIDRKINGSVNVNCQTQMDFMDYDKGGWPLIIGNPPFSQAEDHVAHALDLLKPDGGMLVFLLPLGFVASQGRERGVMQDFKQLKWTAPIVPRPSFSGEGSDRTDCMVYCWQRNWAEPARWEKHILWERP